jgi:hydroxysqualene dehydroxylase
MPKRSIAIIGGGMAGLAAAATLVKQGQQVTLFEASATLGGRARGIDYNGLRLDNGQHILLGAYKETLNLLQLAGIDEKLNLKRLPLSLLVHDLLKSPSFSLNAPPSLPAPLHILIGLLSAQGVTLAEKFSAIRFMAWMRLKQFKLTQDQPLAVLLQAHQQSAKFIQFLWEPLCLAALNTPLKLASAQVFLNVLRDSFAQDKNDADILLARCDLSSLISEPLEQYILANNGVVNTGSTVTNIEANDDGYQVQSNENTANFSHIVIACGPHQLKSFNESLPKLAASVAHLQYQAITTVYLQYAPTAKLAQPMLGLVNSLSQWVFDREQICGQAGLMAVVISAHPALAQSQAQLAELVAAELLTVFPDLGQPLWHKVITEKRATFGCNSALKRPANITPYPNLYLAGDYTAGDYPATIEGAVRSGIQAANHIIRH